MKAYLRPILNPVRAYIDTQLADWIFSLEKIYISKKSQRVSSSKKYHVGIIGAGDMGIRQIDGLESSKKAKVVACADLNEQKLNGIKKKYRDINFYTSHTKMLADEKLDLVSVATTAESHCNLSKCLAQSGIKNIIIEKPFCTNLMEGMKLISFCNENGVSLTVNHGRRWSRTYQEIKHSISCNEIGQIRQIYFSWRKGGLANLGTHFIDMIRYLTGGQVEWVCGRLSNDKLGTSRGIKFSDPGGVITIMLKGGVRCYLDLSSDLQIAEKTFILQGSKGRIEIDENRSCWHLFTPPIKDGKLRKKSFSFNGSHDIGDLFKTAVEKSLSCKETICSGEDGYKACEVIIAAHKSNLEGNTPVTLPLSGNVLEKTWNFS